MIHLPYQEFKPIASTHRQTYTDTNKHTHTHTHRQTNTVIHLNVTFFLPRPLTGVRNKTQFTRLSRTKVIFFFVSVRSR